MGIIPAAALDVATTYVADVLAVPLPVALAAVMAVLTVIGLRILGESNAPQRPCIGPALCPRRRLPERSRRLAMAAVLPRLPQRSPQTRTPRPAPLPDVAASRLLRGPPGQGCLSRRRRTSGGASPR